jgi:hypothetical protein
MSYHDRNYSRGHHPPPCNEMDQRFYSKRNYVTPRPPRTSGIPLEVRAALERRFEKLSDLSIPEDKRTSIEDERERIDLLTIENAVKSDPKMSEHIGRLWGRWLRQRRMQWLLHVDPCTGQPFPKFYRTD